MQVGFSKKKIYIDEGLFERILQGEQDAFRELYELTYRPLYAFLLSLTQNSEDAQDLLQDTYIQIRANCHQYQCRGNPMAWMMKISKNLFLMKCRQEKNRASVSYEEIEKELGVEDLSNVDNRLLLEKMFSILSDEERNIIIMKDVNGLKHKEIADLMEKPVGTVLTKYNRGIRKLQREFGKR